MDRKSCLACSAPFIPFAAVLVVGVVLTMRDQARRREVPAAVATPGQRAFFTAARLGDVAALRDGIGRGQEVNAREPAHGRTALMRAAAFGHLEAVQLLLASRADPRAADAQKLTALHIAADAGEASVIAPLVAAGADPSALAEYGAHPLTPLGVALREGHLDVVTALLAAGADSDRAGPRELPPIQAAIESHRPDLVRALIAGRAALRIPGSASILHFALRDCRLADLEIVKLLVEAGADTRARDERGDTPLELIEKMDPRRQTVDCYPPIAAYLRSAGAPR
jgi:uncharacterized protein